MYFGIWDNTRRTGKRLLRKVLKQMFTFNEIDKLIGLKQQTNVTSFRSILVYRALKYVHCKCISVFIF